MLRGKKQNHKGELSAKHQPLEAQNLTLRRLNKQKTPRTNKNPQEQTKTPKPTTKSTIPQLKP